MDYSPTPSSSSSNSSSSSVHHASLVSPSMHSPALLEMVDLKITRPVIEYTVDMTIETVDFAMGRPSSSRGRSLQRNPIQSKFTTFVTNVLTRAEVSMATLIATLAYIDRARPHLHIALEEWALERVFLGAIIVASKYTNDSTLKNVHWAMCTQVFGKRDVGRIEREFLDVLDWELGLSESDLLSHHDGVTRALHQRHSHSHHLHPAFASQPNHRHFASAPTRRHQRVSSSPSDSSSLSSDDDSMDSPRTPAAPSPMSVSSKTHHQTHGSLDLGLLKSFPLPLPVPIPQSRHSNQPLRLSA